MYLALMNAMMSGSPGFDAGRELKLFRPRAERESEAAHQGGFPGCTGQHGKGSQCQGAPKHLGTAPAEYPSAQAPQPLGFAPQPERLAQRDGDDRRTQVHEAVDQPGRCCVLHAANIAQSSNQRSTTCR